MDAAERTRDIYEQITAYPKPPLVPLPGPNEIDALLAASGWPPGSAGNRISWAAFALTGIKPFLRRLPDHQEQWMRRCDQRGAWLFAPLVSATIALEDDRRGLTPVERAATLLHGARSLHRDLYAGRLPPDTYRGQPLEMGQYPNLFATTLIVEGRRARIFKSSRLGQVTVVVRNRLYLLDIGQPGDEAPVSQIIQGLQTIVELAHAQGPADDTTAPGLLTCASHVTQCRLFPELSRDASNRAALDTLRHSFVTLCLDLDDAPATYAEALHHAHAGRPANRWWHASLQLVVTGNAKACAICNFNAYLDGNVMMRGGAEIQQRAAACVVSPSDQAIQPHPAPPIELKWSLRPESTHRAQRDLAPFLDSQQATFAIEGLGSTFFAAHKVDAIPAFVLALQMTAVRLSAEPAKITQFLTMSRYRCMDLTTATVTTPEVLRFVDYMQAGTVDRAEARAAMQTAIAAQVERCRLARERLPLEDIIGLAIFARRGLARAYTSAIFVLRALSLQWLGGVKRAGRDIIISHPEIQPAIPLVGRPGVRLPYVRHFALHYQMWPDKIIVTFMPGMHWKIPNAQLVAELETDLRRLQALIA